MLEVILKTARNIQVERSSRSTVLVAMSELGELAEEINISTGNSYKPPRVKTECLVRRVMFLLL